MEQRIIISRIPGEEQRKKRLRTVIKKKRTFLLSLTTKFQTLESELELIKREYYTRVGTLFTKDNELDMEIIKYKNLLALLRNGASYDEAKEAVRETYGEYHDSSDAFFDNTTHAQDHSNGEKQQTPETDSVVKDEQSLKSLWKKATMKFHPDLVTDPEEKKEREEMMKKINAAYADGDFELLQQLYRSRHLINMEDATISDLEQVIIELENMTIKLQNEFAALRQTEWFGWKAKMRKAKKTGTDVFKDLEYSLLDDIGKKMEILKKLKKEVDGYTV